MQTLTPTPKKSSFFDSQLTPSTDSQSPLKPSTSQNQALLFQAVKEQKPELMKTLLEQGTDPNCKNLVHETPLHLAAEIPDYEIAELLLSHKADPNCATIAGETPLHLSSFTGDTKMLKLLLSNGANPNIADTILGRTALHCAVQCDHLDCVALLISQGSTPDFADFEGLRPIDCTKNTDILEVLIGRTGKNSKYIKQKDFEAGERTFDYSFSSEDSVNFSIASNSYESLESEMVDQKSCADDLKLEEKNRLFLFLKGIRLAYYKDCLISNGFDDLEMMTFQMNTPYVITHDMLEASGVNKHGHRARILMKLEQCIGSIEKEDRDWEWCRAQIPAFQVGFSLKDWLSFIRLECYQKLFECVGYDDHFFMISLMNSKYPVDDSLLYKIGIIKIGHRARILAKLMFDASETRNRSARSKESCGLL